ncbi:MAG: general secretion pathway protein GspB [Candidatus Aminicenantes bacterium]|nr:general secretion pathway protein GspB [Candidatus Aminicenantes bacterium]
MSSILKALKKAEAESADREAQGSAQKINKKSGVNRDAGASRGIYRSLFFAAVVLLVAAAAWIFFTAIKKPPLQNEPGVSPKKAAAAVLATQPPTLEVEKEIKQEAGQTAGEKTGESVQETPPPEIAAEQAKPASSPLPVSPRSGDSSPLPASSRSGNSSRPGMAKKSSSPAPVRAVVKSKPSSSSQFILKGIIWSDNPARRVALINNRYLKEGEKINGVELIRIARDEVILKSGEREWAIKVQK